MKSIKFKESRVVYAEGDPVYETHAYRDDSPNGQKDIVICYKLTWLERLMVLFTGVIWTNITTLDGNIRPMRMSAVKSHMITNRKQRRDKEKLARKLGVSKMDKPPAPPKKKYSIPPPAENGMSAVK